MVTPPSADWIRGQFTDLPVPDGFTLVADESFVFVQGSVRSADLNYTGDRTVSELIGFYQESMSTSGWRFLRMTGVRMKTLSYLKGDEICEIIMEVHAPHDEHAELQHWESQHEEVQFERERESLTHLHIKLNAY